MYKKNVTVSSHHVLGGKDAKQLKAQLVKLYGGVLKDDQLSSLLPGKAGIVQSKLSNRSVVYAIEGGNPMFFDPDGRGAVLLPTVYALALQPGLLPSMLTWSEVSPKVLGGADLFLQGFLLPGGAEKDLPPFLAGSLLSLRVPGNPLPFALGKMAVSRTEALREGMKGRGMEVLHVYGDLLWQMGDKVPPNAGFTKDRVFPLEDAAPTPDAPAAPEPSAGGSGDALAPALEAATLNDGSEVAAAAVPSAVAGGALDMDSLLELAVLQGLHSLRTAELPIQSSDFYTRHMIPCRPDGVTFDFKQSKYKKLGKLLDKFEKDKAGGAGVLTQKVIRKQDHISAVNRSHPAYLAAAPAAVGGEASSPSTTQAAPSKSAASEGGGGSKEAPQGQSLRVTYVYRAPGSLRPIFGEAAVQDRDRLYEEREVESALAQYAAREGLEVPGGGIRLDHLLHGSLYNKKEEAAQGAVAPAPELLRRLLGKLQLHHHLTRTTEQGEVVVTRKGALRPVAICSERRHGRNVTSVSRLESVGLDPEEMASQFQRKFQTSCTVSKLPGNQEKDCEILMQGDLLRQVAEFLSTTHGISPQHMETKAKAK